MSGAQNLLLANTASNLLHKGEGVTSSLIRWLEHWWVSTPQFIEPTAQEHVKSAWEQPEHVTASDRPLLHLPRIDTPTTHQRSICQWAYHGLNIGECCIPSAAAAHVVHT